MKFNEKSSLGYACSFNLYYVGFLFSIIALAIGSDLAQRKTILSYSNNPLSQHKRNFRRIGKRCI
jgi:hypothetical protein